MPSKKKKYNARFPAGRIKKIMQTDEDVGKVAQAVPVIISRTLELFVESLLKRAVQITSAKNAKTLTPSHMKQCILSESRFDFLKDLVRGIPDVSSVDDECMSHIGNNSPGIASCFGKSAGNYSSFQFQRKSDGGSSKTSGTTSQSSPVLQAPLQQFYKEIAIGSGDLKREVAQPLPTRAPVIQHTGSTINNRSSIPLMTSDKEKSSLEINTRPGDGDAQNENKFTNCINVNEKGYCLSDEEEEDEDEDDEDEDDGGNEVDREGELRENGFYKLQIVTKTCSIDEDYDT